MFVWDGCRSVGCPGRDGGEELTSTEDGVYPSEYLVEVEEFNGERGTENVRCFGRTNGRLSQHGQELPQEAAAVALKRGRVFTGPGDRRTQLSNEPRWPLAGEVCGDDPRGDEGEPRDGAVFFGTSFIRRVRLETQVRLAPASPKSDDVPAATSGQWRIDSWAQIPAGSPCQTDQAAEVRATAMGPGLLENYLVV